MACLDTDLLVALLREDPKAVETIDSLEQGSSPIYITSITAYELFKGAGISANAKHNVGLVKEVLSNLHILELNSAASERAGDICSRLDSKGKEVGEFDILIAGICLANDVTLISNDEHFEKIDGLKIKRW